MGAASDLWKTGLGLIWLGMLEEAGYHCLDDLAAATDEELLKVPGLGPFKLRAIRKATPVRQAEQLRLEEAEVATGEGTDALDALSY